MSNPLNLSDATGQKPPGRNRTLPGYGRRPKPTSYPAGSVSGIADSLKSSCCDHFCGDEYKVACAYYADQIEIALGKAREQINKTGGVTRFDFAGNVCTECSEHAASQLNRISTTGGFFDYRRVQKVPWIDTPVWAGHEWLEITCPNTGEIVATVDFWVGSGTKPGWMPGEDGFGWTPNAGLPGQPVP